MFLVTTLVLGALLALILGDYVHVIYVLEKTQRDRNRAIARIARLKKLLTEKSLTE